VLPAGAATHIVLAKSDTQLATNRQTGGDHYERLTNAFRRLAGTHVETNIVTNGQRIREQFSLLDNWKTIEKTDTGRLIQVELTLNEWLFNAITTLEVRTLNRDYFRLDGGLERQLYELARKHCGRQAQWAVGIDLLYKLANLVVRCRH
jgi:plasmid replication initiation protein